MPAVLTNPIAVAIREESQMQVQNLIEALPFLAENGNPHAAGMLGVNELDAHFRYLHLQQVDERFAFLRSVFSFLAPGWAHGEGGGIKAADYFIGNMENAEWILMP